MLKVKTTKKTNNKVHENPPEEQIKKEAIEKPRTREQCGETKRVLPAEKSHERTRVRKLEEKRQETKTGKELGRQ